MEILTLGGSRVWSDEVINVELISGLLEERGLVRKEFGLCSEPWSLFYEVGNVDKRGVSHAYGIPNQIYIDLNEVTTSRKKTIYFYSVDIRFVNGFYYFYCLAQDSFYKKSEGAEHVVYKVSEDEIGLALDEIFKHVEN